MVLAKCKLVCLMTETEYDNHSGISFVDISNIIAMLGDFPLGTIPFYHLSFCQRLIFIET